MTDPVVLMMGGGVLVVLLCVFFAFADGGNKKQAKRVDRLRTRGQEATPGAEELKLVKDGGDRKKLDQMVRRFVPKPDVLRQRLQRTGRSISLGGFGIACGVVAAVAFAVVLILGFSFLIALPLSMLAGMWLPYMVIVFLGKRRAGKFLQLFPEAVGLMVRGLKSGLPITETFQIVAAEIGDPVGIEFRQVTDQIRLGHPPEQALLDAAQRVGVPELKFLTVTLSIQRETGGNLAESLENLDNILRRRRQMKLKIKAMSSEARASAMIIGALPFIMMVLLSLINHSYIALLFTTERGHHMLEFGGCMMLTGIGVMAKMVKFEI
ncbi:MAG TPA: type II secretion system F family protein [Stellaceae bacterium]